MNMNMMNNNNMNMNMMNNNNMNMNMALPQQLQQNIVNNIPNQNQSEQNQNNENSIFVTFTFKKNKKQLYIDVDKNETFLGALTILEDKYEWLKTIDNKKYYFKGEYIPQSKFNQKICQLGIEDNSDIFIKYD